MHTSLRLDAEPESAATARRCIVRVAAMAGAPQGARDALAAVTTELVANAVRHGREPIDLDLFWEDGSWRIEVHDGAPYVDMVVLARDRTRVDSGRGLLIVDALSDAWGTERGPEGGKVVWAERRAEADGASSAR